MRQDRSVAAWFAVIAGVGAASAVAAPLWFLFAARWREGVIGKGVGGLFRDVWLPITVLVASVVVHELLHALGWVVWGKVPWRAIRFGIHWLSLSPYAHLTVPIAVRPYRCGVVLPGLVLGLIPALVACVTGNGGLFAYGLVMILVAGGDLVVLAMLLRVPGDWLVQDHANRVGVASSSPNHRHPYANICSIFHL